jgi:hypothetical protein
MSAILSDNRSAPPDRDPPPQTLGGHERLAGLGFRSWLAGYQNNQMTYWEDAWNLYAQALGPVPARTAIRDLSAWVRAISDHAQRPIRLYPAQCERFTHDECLAVSMIAAAQHNCPAIRACAYALLGAQPLDEVLARATRFAACLSQNQILLGPGPIVDPLATPQLIAPGCLQ